MAYADGRSGCSCQNGETLNDPVTGDSTIATSAQYPFQIPTDGSLIAVKAGQFLGYTDNSGYGRESTVTHLHMGVMPADKNWNALQSSNGFVGCVDPQPFYNTQFAEDIGTEQAIVDQVAKVTAIVQQATDAQIPHVQKLNLLQEMERFLQSILERSQSSQN